MPTYELKNFLPDWHFEPATVRQLKVLRFFGIAVEPLPTKGRASSVIGRLFSDPAKKRLWMAYVYTSGDKDQSSPELLPYDRAVLAGVVVPEDWHPDPGPRSCGERRKAMEKLVGDLLKEGSPFDDEPPNVPIRGTCFAFTGKFGFGSRRECEAAVVSRGGSFTDGVNSKTDVLVIGHEASPSWAHGNYGSKIEAAIFSRMERGRPVIIPEALWRKMLTS